MKETPKTISTIIATAFIAVTGTWVTLETVPDPVVPKQDYTYEKVDDSTWKETYSTCSVRTEIHNVEQTKRLIQTYAQRKKDVQDGKQPALENVDYFIQKFTKELEAASDAGVSGADSALNELDIK